MKAPRKPFEKPSEPCETGTTGSDQEAWTADLSTTTTGPQDRVGRKLPKAPPDLEALTQVIARAQLGSTQAPQLDPTSLGNIARRAGVPDWNIQAALRQRAPLGQALVDAGALSEKLRDTLIKRQRAMREGRPTRHDARDLMDLATDRTLRLAGVPQE